jgi:hypothetical protein
LKKAKRISPLAVAGKIFSVCLMMFCLTFLTCVNYFAYPSSDVEDVASLVDKTGDNAKPTPPNPTEEKSGSSISILEEFIHENHFSIDLSWFDINLLKNISDPDKLAKVHFELISPPPEA